MAAATRQALADGLDQVTLRSVAEDLGVVSSLVSHYFPSVDMLLAEAFAAAAGSELDEIWAEAAACASPVESLRALLISTVSRNRDRISLLWIDAWNAGRRRPSLHAEVAEQQARWIARITGLLESGRSDGMFTTADPRMSAMRIVAVIDGLSVQAVMATAIDYDSVSDLAFHVAERELGLAAGDLSI